MMQTTELKIERAEANRLYKEYLKDRHFDTPIDQEIRRTYKALARGQTIIKALESIVTAGVDHHGLPKLAIVRADQTRVICDRERDGRFRFFDNNLGWSYHSRSPDRCFKFPVGSLPTIPDPRGHGGWWADYEAIVPLVPKHLRPRSSLANYHILFEAEWDRVVPKDPFLLRRMGKGDLWLVVAAWDLTEVERAALQARVSVN